MRPFPFASISDSVTLDGAVNRIVIPTDEFRQYVDVSVSVSVRQFFVQLIANRAMATFYYSAFHIRCLLTSK